MREESAIVTLDWVATTISVAALVTAVAGFLLNWRQIRIQDRQFEDQLITQRELFERQLAAQETQFGAQLKAESEKLLKLAGMVDTLQRGTKAQEELARITERQNQLLESSTQVQREQLERDKRSWGRRLLDGIFGG